MNIGRAAPRPERYRGADEIASEDGYKFVEDQVDHPPHYTAHPSGVECIDIARQFNFALGSVIKYVWRAGLKSKDPVEDLKKARWYLDDEIKRLGGTP